MFLKKRKNLYAPRKSPQTYNPNALKYLHPHSKLYKPLTKGDVYRYLLPLKKRETGLKIKATKKNVL